MRHARAGAVGSAAGRGRVGDAGAVGGRGRGLEADGEMGKVGWGVGIGIFSFTGKEGGTRGGGRLG